MPLRQPIRSQAALAVSLFLALAAHETTRADSPSFDCPSKSNCPTTDEKAWELPQPALFDRLGIASGGWVETGITMNAHGRSDGFNGPVLLNDSAGEFQMNQLWFYLDRPVETGGCGYDFGGRIDVVYGTDGRIVQSPGLEARINSVRQAHALVLAQFYVEAGIDDLTIKAGRFGHILGYETAFPTVDFFYSKPYSLTTCEPWLLTGAAATWNASDQWSFNAGFHRGYCMFEDVNNKLDLLLGAEWNSSGELTRLSWRGTIGPQDAAGESNRVVYALTLQHDVNERWRVATIHFFGHEDNTGPGGRNAQWGGVGQYFLRTINSRWSAGVRTEWCRDDSGTRFAGLGHVCPSGGWPGGPGFIGDFTTLTLGLNYRPHANVTLRPEARWDWYTGTRDNDANLPFDAGRSARQFLLATDLVVTF